MRPLLLDLFCGAGGAAVGYHRAGFDVIGVDNRPQPRYPFECWQLDALDALRQLVAGETLVDFAAIHASPPCQRYSVGLNVWHDEVREWHPDLIEATRELLVASGRPYVIENIPGSPLLDPVRICGSALGLDVERHRLFECSFSVLVPPCAHGWQTPRFAPNRSGRVGRLARVITVAGRGSPPDEADAGEPKVEQWRRAMEIDWMSREELREAIPPAYTELLGLQLLRHLQVVA